MHRHASSRPAFVMMDQGSSLRSVGNLGCGEGFSCKIIRYQYELCAFLSSDPVRLQIAATPEEGIAMAQDAQRSGRAADTLRKWVEVSQDALLAETA